MLLRRIALIWVAAWLLLSTARQCFDLLGKLWALVVFDLVQVLALCSTLFAILHLRRPLMPFVAAFSLLSFGFNIALLLWWFTELLAEQRTDEMLSFGLPFGHSFFLRHTPFCPAHFNLTTNHWQQTSDCPVPYSYLEGAQSLLHALLALGTFAIALFMFFCANQQQQKPAAATSVGASRTTTETIMAIGGGRQQQQMGDGASVCQQIDAVVNDNRQGQQLQTSQDIYSSGYLNSLYDENGIGGAAGCSASENNHPPQQQTKRPQFAPVMPVRRSFPRRRQQQRKEGSGRKMALAPASVAAEHYSSLSTAECISSACNIFAPKSPAAPYCSYSSDSSSHDSRRRLHSPFYTHCQPMLPSQQQSPFSSLLNNANAQQRQLQQSQMSTGRRSSLLTFAPINSTIAAPKTPCITSPTSTSDAYEFAGNVTAALRRGTGERRSGTITSLVSFDPKADAGQLIRVRELRTLSDDEEEEAAEVELRGQKQQHQGINTGTNQSQDSIPSIEAPKLPPVSTNLTNSLAGVPVLHSFSGNPAQCAAMHRTKGEAETIPHQLLFSQRPFRQRIIPTTVNNNDNNIRGGYSSSNPYTDGGDNNNIHNSFPIPDHCAQLTSPSPGIQMLCSPHLPQHQWMMMNGDKQHSFLAGEQQQQQQQQKPRSCLSANEFAAAAAPHPQRTSVSSSAPIYETYVGSCPLDARTSFPVQHGGLPRRSMVQLAAASEIRLSRQDLSGMEKENGEQKPTTSASAIFGVGMVV